MGGVETHFNTKAVTLLMLHSSIPENGTLIMTSTSKAITMGKGGGGGGDETRARRWRGAERLMEKSEVRQMEGGRKKDRIGSEEGGE